MKLKGKYGRYVPWWKIDNLLLSTEQMRRVGLYPEGQLTLWL